MDYTPPTHTYTPEQYKKLIDAWILKTTPTIDENGKEVFKTLPNPATLRIHTKLSASTICEYKNKESNKAYRKDTYRAYDHMEAYGWSDLHNGNGNGGKFMLGRVCGYAETQKVESKVDLQAEVSILDTIRRAANG